ncbi:MAG TPA: Holliday junction resolvase RuvX [Candidatus Sulfotelmatobacter sp.]|nr:Holliday junction resolvase RuvX [Candidatus Sulfotelmatobacter sp.]
MAYAREVSASARLGESSLARGRRGIHNRAVDQGEKDQGEKNSQIGPGARGSSEDSSNDARGPRTSDLGRRTAGRVLGLDVGARRIGMAVSDPLGITAQGLETLQRRNKRADFEQLRVVIREYKVKEIVVGLPLRMSGAEGIQSEKMRVFAEELRKRFKLPVHLWDERLTSAEANRFLRETELSIEKRGKAVDRMAAVLILQGWMEGNRLPASGSRLPE